MKFTIAQLDNLDYLYTYDLGDISYKVRGTRGHFPPYYFLSYREQNEEKVFTNVPYDDIRFFATIKRLASGKVQCDPIYILINDRTEQVDWEIIKKTWTAEKLSQHPIWCVVANFVRERSYGLGGQMIVNGGTKHFSPGTKVYCYPPMQGDGYARVQVLANHRVSHRYITIFTDSTWLENWRVELVYSPRLIIRLIEYWDWTPEDKSLAEELVALGKVHAKPLPEQRP